MELGDAYFLQSFQVSLNFSQSGSGLLKSAFAVISRHWSFRTEGLTLAVVSLNSSVVLHSVLIGSSSVFSSHLSIMFLLLIIYK